MPLRLSRRRVSTRPSKRRSTRRRSSRHSKRRSRRSSSHRSKRRSRRSSSHRSKRRSRKSSRRSKRRSRKSSRRSKRRSSRNRSSSRRRSRKSSGGAKRGPARRGLEYVMERKRSATKKRRAADDCCCHTKNGNACGLYVGKAGDQKHHLCWRHLKCSSPLSGAIGMRRKCSTRSKSRSRSRSVSPRPLSRRSSSPPPVPPRSTRRSSPKVSPPPVPARSMSSNSKKIQQLVESLDPRTAKLLGDGGAVTQNRSINADSIAWGLRHTNDVIQSYKKNKKISPKELTDDEKLESAVINEALKIPVIRETFGGIEKIDHAIKGKGGGPFTDWIKGGEPVYYVPKK